MPGTKRKKTSPAWEYFTTSADGSTASCQLCSKDVKTSKGATTGLLRHLYLHHEIHLNGNAEQSNPISTIRQLQLEELVGKMAALDGFSFNSIATSTSIKAMYEFSTKKKFPKSPTTVRDVTLKVHQEKKAIVIDQIKQAKLRQGVLSVSLDEWTSAANRRYMNVTVHSLDDFWNLGLARITGSFTAQACKNLLISKLEEFEMTLDDDIFGVVSDGAAVMTSFGRLSGRRQQLCMAHAIHLAVVDVLYSASVLINLTSETLIVEPPGEALDSEDAYGIPFGDADDDQDVEYEADLSVIITKVRKIVKIFSRSSQKEEKLKRYSGGLTLLLDTRTRWNSLLAMLERFVTLKEAIQKALIDIGEVFTLTTQEFDAVEEVVKVLLPVKVAAEALCRRDATLITADVALQFMMKKLGACESEIGRALRTAMRRRLLGRRNDLSECASYLHYGNDDELQGHEDDYFTKITRSELVMSLKQLYEDFIGRGQRLDENVLESSENDNTEASESLLVDISLEAELNLAITDANNYKLPDVSTCPRTRPVRDADAVLIASIKKEMSTLENHGRRGRILQALYDMLKSLPPSTVESERVFSVSNNFCTKTRSRLGDKTLDALVFLKSYFKKS